MLRSSPQPSSSLSSHHAPSRRSGALAAFESASLLHGLRRRCSMRYHRYNLWLSRSGVVPLPARRRAETDLGLRGYMLEVYDYVAGGLAVTGVGAYAVTVSGFHASMIDQTPSFLMPFMWILLLAPLALVMLLWLNIDEVSFFAAQATAW